MPDPIYPPKDDIVARAHVRSMQEYEMLYRQSIDEPETFWGEQAKMLSLYRPFERVLHCDYERADFSWFHGAKLNVAYNCVERHLPEKAAETAIIWAADEPGEYRHISYGELHENVCRMANVLIGQGVAKGDRVCLYLPMIPELAYAMLACARIGAIHSVVFAGFSAESLRDRILDAECRIVLTDNE